MAHPGGDRRSRAVTRADVARYARVSSAVVSYVVNNGPRPVAPATAARVREAIEVLGYRPNSSARALRLGTSGLLGLIVPDTSNPFFAEYALAIEQAATERGLALLVANSNSDLALEARLIADLTSRHLDGLIVAGAAGPPVASGRAERLPTIPTVFIDSALPYPGHNTVGSATHAGAAQAVHHLTDGHGHDTVALVMGEGVRQSMDEREIGWRETLLADDRREGAVVRVPFSRLGGYLGGQRLLRLRPLPTAVFVSSDLQAMGFLRAAHELGVRVPEDVAVVAFDGTQQGEFSWPPLTCARQQVGRMAEAAVGTVLAPPDPGVHQVFGIVLVVRRSCGCPGSTEPTATIEEERAERSPDLPAPTSPLTSTDHPSTPPQT